MNKTLLALLIASTAILTAADKIHTPWIGQYLYGRAYTTKEERAAYRAEMRTKKTYEEQLAFWREHIAMMKQRAWDRGLVLEEPPAVTAPGAQVEFLPPIFAMDLMESTEIEQYRADEREISSKEEWDRFVMEHREKMIQRAFERGLTVERTPEQQEADKEALRFEQEQRRKLSADRRTRMPQE